ncbi:MAG: cytochrome c peroxidase [Bdellovibrionia bacterium]
MIFFLVTSFPNINHAQGNSTSELKKAFFRPLQIPYPKDNLYSKAKEDLGKLLFFDPRISGSNVTSCATCHNPSLSWGDSLAKGVGHGHLPLGRRSPTVLNLAWTERLFWDGRAASLEEQALGPIQSEAEMNMVIDNLPKKLLAITGYPELFKKAFPGELVTNQLVAKAIATFERTLISEPSPFDGWVSGNERAISNNAKKGFAIFNGKAKCVTCHSGWNFTDGSFHDIGMPDADLGRGKFLPKLISMQHAFKTPTLRDVARRSPYMHDGSERTLQDVIAFYDQGGKAAREGKSEDIHPLNLTSKEKTDLEEFLKSLTSDPKPFQVPILPN